ncbi:polyprenyl synthetase family protein [Paenibacillus harenae]|uniref:Competence protein ComQ n=1 Tax=Paenibacillus harenae TaxID=306543 RepID=A0ABT9U7V3_PAEHA|nr:polyprenyl synthetase family protein [Paenibacillus harenae]MDQ0063524.1 competence protein ComQ [Paenibacillus harenae]MDQ0115717.1 competence protein ComQ [Paenibacillus harenae]
MINGNTLIEQHMRDMVGRYFTAEPLLRYALQFTEDKLGESIKFGQLTLLHYRMFGGTAPAIYQAAAAVELFILASDIFDDLQDQDAPGKSWMQVPAPIAIHVASSLLTLSQQAMQSCEFDQAVRLALIGLMNDQLLRAANGQMLDLMDMASDEQSYLETVKLKSASLLLFACMTGVIAAGKPWQPVVAEYAQEIGIAAQIRNDLRDLLRWDEKSDFLQRKRTLLTMYLVESVSGEDKWIADYFEGLLSIQDVERRSEMFEEAVERSGALLYGAVMSRMHYNRFEELLDSMQEISPWKSDFLHMLNGEIA